jgi:hypothetical protein
MELNASSWFYYKEICYDAWSHERKKKWKLDVYFIISATGGHTYYSPSGIKKPDGWFNFLYVKVE